MSRQPSALVSIEQAEASVSTHPLDVERDRPKRIDQYIDYFGGGGMGRPFPENRSPLDRSDSRGQTNQLTLPLE